ncbi:flagellar basal-body MS-ring/collar protein FliF [Marinimicrobium sp. ABcell2]|nr:flagellar basal-body MS-ring/collar protein FliF [Marinimicrobium sp. ABcell2]MDQ2078097.1 flagellar basal-body MS-ring/collar protein FliF [Marinimicrobium sp. ABcell2]
MAPTKSRPRGDLFEGFNNLSLLRQAGLMVGLAASVAIGFAVVLWTQGEDYRPLYASLDRLDTSEVFDILDQNRISYKIDSSTGALLVPANDIHMARIRLAEVGVPGRRSQGFELMDQEQPLGTSQFVESTRYHRSIEGELARTITSINSVRSARVHLAIPKRSVFVRDVRQPKASVFLEVFPGRSVEPAQVTAIINLVASSIAELVPEEVTVVDQRGNLLSKMEDNKELLLADRQRAYARRVEEQIASRVNGILEPILGSDRYRAEVSADIDFTAVEQAAETFNPDLAAIRSEQILNEARDGADFGVGIPGALTNQPPGTAEAPEQIDPETGLPVPAERPRNRREQATRNFELDRTISYTRHQQGRIQRLSVAVVVDDKVVMGEEGQELREAWTAAEIERMETLVRDAVGFSAARGDSVNVLNSPFRVRDIVGMDIPEIPWWQEEWVLSYLKQGAGVLVILMLIFGLLRPVLKNLASTGGRISEEQEARELAALEAAGLGGYGGSSDETVTLTGGALGLPGPEEGYEQQLNAIKGLVADDPGRVAQVVKAWINKDE